MKCVLIVMIVLLGTALWAEGVIDSLPIKKGAVIGVWGFSEHAFGIGKSVTMRGIQYGLAVEIMSRIQVKGYGSRYGERVHLFDDPKYLFEGAGVRIGPVFHSNKLDIIPSIGWGRGTLRIGEGDYIEGLIGHSYQSYRHKEISYVPISLEVQAKLGRMLLLSGRLSAALNSDYPVGGVCGGLAIGWK